MRCEPLARVQAAFADCPRPIQFVGHHCDECIEHDTVLHSHTPETIGLTELGMLGWDPFCFVNTEGYLYYLPALVRLALGVEEDYYLGQFLFHLTEERLLAMNRAQRAAVLMFLEYVREHLIDEIRLEFDLAPLDERLGLLHSLLEA